MFRTLRISFDLIYEFLKEGQEFDPVKRKIISGLPDDARIEAASTVGNELHILFYSEHFTDETDLNIIIEVEFVDHDQE